MSKAWISYSNSYPIAEQDRINMSPNARLKIVKIIEVENHGLHSSALCETEIEIDLIGAGESKRDWV